MFKTLIFLSLVLNSIYAQVTFGTLSSSAIKTASSTTRSAGVTTTVTFGTLSSGKITTTTGNGVTPQITTTTAPITTTPLQITQCSAEVAVLCKNGAGCQIVNNQNFVCLCTTGFSGVFCEKQDFTTVTPTITTVTTATTTPAQETFIACPQNVCLNGGLCGISTTTGNIKCTCLPNFKGDRCETTVPFCEGEPCKNGGICLQTDVANGICFCAEKYSGRYCEAQGCTPNPCQNNQACITNANGQARCLCSNAYTGAWCETPIPL